MTPLREVEKVHWLKSALDQTLGVLHRSTGCFIEMECESVNLTGINPLMRLLSERQSRPTPSSIAPMRLRPKTRPPSEPVNSQGLFMENLTVGSELSRLEARDESPLSAGLFLLDAQSAGCLDEVASQLDSMNPDETAIADPCPFGQSSTHQLAAFGRD